MFRIEWLQLLLLSLPLVFALLLSWRYRRQRPAWLREVAQALGGSVTGPGRVDGVTEGLPWTAKLSLGLGNHPPPSWHLTFPTVSSTDFVVSAETRQDGFWKRRGFVEELSVGDAAFDTQHLLLCPRKKEAGALLSHAPLREALSALKLGKLGRPQGRILWVQAGKGLEAELDVSAVEESQRHPRLAALFDQVRLLAKTLQEAPERGTPGRWRPRLMDTQSEWRGVFLALWALCIVGLSAIGLVEVGTGAVEVPFGFWKSAGVGLTAAGVLAALYLVRLRHSPYFHRRILRVPVVLVAGFIAGPVVSMGLNAVSLPSTPQAQAGVMAAQVLHSYPQHVGVLEFWQLELTSLGRVRLPYEAGADLRKADYVEVQVTQGLLGHRRIQSLKRVRRGP
jgi:hypothetical protein